MTSKATMSLKRKETDPTLNPEHNIFLSHSGAQKPFVEQLCKDLEEGCHYPFFDQSDDSLPKGQEFASLIFDAARQRRVGVVVLSKEFLTSKWPMQELVAFVNAKESENKSLDLLPLFFKLSTADLSDECISNRWMGEWTKLAEKDSRVDVEKWKKAVQELRAVNGLEFARFGNSEVSYRKAVVKAIFRLGPPDLMYDTSDVQGYDRMCKKLSEMFVEYTSSGDSESPQPLRLGLYGMSGLGKTTMCEALCNHFQAEFCGRVCHVELASEPPLVLQKNLLRKLLRLGENVLQHITDTSQGQKYLKENMRRQPVFLVIDNVVDEEASRSEARAYLEAGFHPDSKIMVTSRSRDVVKALLDDPEYCKPIPELMMEEAAVVFLRKAAPGKEFLSLNGEERRIVDLCLEQCRFSLDGDPYADLKKVGQYHPLALGALGVYFHDIDNSNLLHWEERINDFDKLKLSRECQGIFLILGLQFGTFDTATKLIFLDVALYAHGRIRQELNSLKDWVDWLAALHNETENLVKRKLRVLERGAMINQGESAVTTHDLYKEYAEWYVTEGVDAEVFYVYRKHAEDLPRELAFPPGKLQSMSSPSKDGDKLACANRKSFAGRGPNSPSKFPSSPPGVAMTRSDDINDIIFTESPALFARQSLEELSRRKSKRITRKHRGQVRASLRQQSLGSEPTAIKPAEGTSSKETFDTWSWKKYDSKPIPRSSMSRVYYRCMSKGCAAKKMVKSSSIGHPSVTEVIYVGSHTCRNPPLKNRHDGAEKVDSHSARTGSDADNEVVNDTQKLRNHAPPARWLDHFQKSASLRRKVDCLEKSEPSDSESSEGQPSEDVDCLRYRKFFKDSDTYMEDTQELGGDIQEWGCSEVPDLGCRAWELPGPSQDLGFSQDFTLDQGYANTKQSMSTFLARSPIQESNIFTLADGLEGLVESSPTEVEQEDATREIEVGTSNADCQTGGALVCNSEERVPLTPSQSNETDTICSTSKPIPTEKLNHLRTLQTGNVFLVAGRSVSTWADRGYFLEFIFLDGQSMSRALGVGLEHSKVIITCNAGIEVIKCEEREWEVLWAEAVNANSSFKVMSIEVPEQHEFAHFNTLSSSETSAMFGVGLDGSAVVKYAYGGADVVHAEDPELESLLWGVAKHLLKLQDSTATGRQHTAADSGGGNEGQGVCNNGRDLGHGLNLPNLFALKNGPNRGENGDGDEDFTGGAGNGRGAIPFVARPLSLRVTVRPGRGGTVMSPAFGETPPKSLSNVSGMFPTLTFEFAKQEAYKTISVQILAECALGEGGPKQREKERFGWYHDNIHVSLKCLEIDTSILLDNYGMVDMGETVKAYTSASSTQSTGSQAQTQLFVQGTIPVVGGIVLQSTSNATHNTVGSGTTAENYEMSSKQIKGFFYRDESSMGEARLSYEFIFGTEVPKDVWKPNSQKRWFLQSGVCETLKPTIMGTWEPQNDEESTLYSFELKRELHERFKIANSLEENGSREYSQEYGVPLYLNHGMTHLNPANGHNQVINEKIKEIPKVILLGERFM